MDLEQISWKARTQHLGCHVCVQHAWYTKHALDMAAHMSQPFFIFYYLKFLKNDRHVGDTCAQKKKTAETHRTFTPISSHFFFFSRRSSSPDSWIYLYFTIFPLFPFFLDFSASHVKSLFLSTHPREQKM